MQTGRFPLGKGRGLTAGELHEMLTREPLIARIGTLDPDGWPIVNPVWFEYDDGVFYILTKELTGFCQNLRRDPRTSLCIDSPSPPYRRVIVRGRAEFVDGDWTERGRRGVRKYLGEAGMAYFEATLHFPRALVRIVPERFSTWNGGGPDRTFTKPARWHEALPGATLESVLA